MELNTIRKLKSMRRSPGIKKTEEKVPTSADCKKIEFNQPIIPKDIDFIDEKCRIRIVELLDSVSYLENYFRGFSQVGESITEWCKELHEQTFEVAKILNLYAETDNLPELCARLKDESPNLEELLNNFPATFEYETSDPKTDLLLNSISIRLEEELAITCNVGYRLCEVMNGTA